MKKLPFLIALTLSLFIHTLIIVPIVYFNSGVDLENIPTKNDIIIIDSIDFVNTQEIPQKARHPKKKPKPKIAQKPNSRPKKKSEANSETSSETNLDKQGEGTNKKNRANLKKLIRSQVYHSARRIQKRYDSVFGEAWVNFSLDSTGQVKNLICQARHGGKRVQKLSCLAVRRAAPFPFISGNIKFRIEFK